VLVLLDDVGWTGVSGDPTTLGNGSDFHDTPRFDSLAAQSVAYSAAYVSPGCQPTRAALLTGQHAARTRLYANKDANRGEAALRLLDAPPTKSTLGVEAITIAETLKTADYRTAHIGKWHLGLNGTEGPVEQGFDVNIGGSYSGLPTGGSDAHWAQADGAFDLPGLEANGVAYQFVADRLTDEALAWLGQGLQEPSFLHLSHFSVHAPIQAPDADVALFEAMPPGVLHTDPVYAGMLYNLDWNIGRLIDYLEQTDDPRNPGSPLMDNTLLIVCSDNGGSGGYSTEGIVGVEHTNNIPLRSGKGTAWEGGVRVPMLIRWDPEGAGGRVVDAPVQHIDVLPTIAELSGATIQTDQLLDGLSLVPTLAKSEAALGRDAIFFHFPAYLHYVGVDAGVMRETPTSLVWADPWKLRWLYESQSWQLYNLSADLGELDNVAQDHPDVVMDLGTQLVDWLVEIEAHLPYEKDTNVLVPLPDPSAL
jgi:arylsulfatase A-like enzyme